MTKTGRMRLTAWVLSTAFSLVAWFLLFELVLCADDPIAAALMTFVVILVVSFASIPMGGKR